MSTIEKLLKKLLKQPIPKDITISEVIKLAKFFGCSIETGGNHQIRIRSKNPKRTIPIPVHRDTVSPVIVAELIELFDKIGEEEKK